jgi:hypothetical protein
VDIYIIGDWLGAGVQWALFRYQETSYGTSIIYIFMDWRYIVRGIIGGRSAIALGIWVLGASLLVLAFLIALFREREVQARVRGYLVLSGTILFLFSIIIQYGILLHGPAGMVIPLGIPVLLILGFVLAGGETEGCGREGHGDHDGGGSDQIKEE